MNLNTLANQLSGQKPDQTLPPSLFTQTQSQTVMTDSRCLEQLEELPALLSSMGVRSVFLVTDTDAYVCSGAKTILEPLLKPFRITCFSGFEPNPKLEDIQAGIAKFRQNPADVVVAIGGGTAIDISKMIAACATDNCNVKSVVLNLQGLPARVCPLIVAPTTAGTGSEATQFAVVYVDGVKYSVDDQKLLPDWCILDPKLTATLPAKITAQSGLDAFCQAIESIWSVRSTESSCRDAVEAAKLAYAHLYQVVHSPTPVSRHAMTRASHLAGRAINRTRTTAPHAVSYALTSDFGIPHGHAVALTIGPMLVHNAGVTDADVNDPRGVAHVQSRIALILQVINCSTPEEGNVAIQQFVRSLGCKTQLGELGVFGEETFRKISAKVNLERLQNNPRRVTSDQLVEMMRSVE
ncbi:phosphonoacetaldehyde reductase [Planctomicrobium sp. SH527]|uniref:phosphonoacetaldehyde reductase n=1 Tax=Planctomicrobium sp. SH527 TaxID=3448123 RepID=UPI003F5B3589